MFKSPLRLAGATALALASGQALATDFAPIDASIDYTVYFSGATASAQFVRNSLIDNACDPNGGLSGKDITVYQKDADDWVLICDLKGAVGGSTVRAIKQGGGSGDGTTPISRPTVSALQYPIPTDAFNPATACASAVTTQTGAGTSFRLYNTCNIPNQPLSGGDIGTSDVEPKLFFDVNTPSTGIAFTADDSALIDVKPLAGLGFGLPMTLGLRNALQALQFPTASACHPSNAAWSALLPTSADTNGDGLPEALDVARVAAGSKNATADVSPSLGKATVADSEACMPSLTRAEVAGILTGRITKWSQLHRDGVTVVEAATAAGLPVPTTSAVPALDNQRVHVCRRNDGSGTQAQFNAFFLDRPCMNVAGEMTAEQPLNPGPSTCSYSTQSVVCSNRGSSEVDRCLNDLENGTTNTSTLFGGAGPLGPRYAWAIGVQSTEKNPDLAQKYRFAKIDELAPTIENVWLGDYFDHYEGTCQMRKDNSAIDPNAVPSELRAIFDAVCVAGPVDVFDTNQNFLHPWGVGGWLSAPLASTGGALPDAPLTAAGLMNPDDPLPINTWTYRGESCSAPVVFDPVNLKRKNVDATGSGASDLLDQLAEAEASAATLQTRLNSANARIASKDTLLAKRTKQVNDRNKIISARNKEITRLRKLLKQKR
ncbi:MAG: substrate-binding domain-containing protein [Gammaproteobacteria bacterium]